MGGKRLYFEAKEAKDAAATGRLLHLAAVALLQGAAAQPEGAAADRLRMPGRLPICSSLPRCSAIAGRCSASAVLCG